MATESLGGSMPAGRPVAVTALGRTHVFAIAAGGAMNHWVSANGGPWTGPSPLPGGNLAASFPCAIVLPNGSVNVFGIANGGPLMRWSSADGNIWMLQLDGRQGIPANGNGLAAASRDGTSIDVFAVTQGGIVRFSFVGATQAPPSISTLPASNGLFACALAAVSPAPGQLDVFAVDPNVGMPLWWHFDGASWSRQMIGGPALHPNSYNGFAAVSPASGRVELFAITNDGRLTNWSRPSGGTAFMARQLPAGGLSLPDGVPDVVAEAGRLDVFAIGRGDALKGGPLVHWRFNGSTWSEPVARESSLAAGGVGAVLGANGVEAFAFASGFNNTLQHWPGGVAAATHNPWANWAGNRRTNPEGHCYPTCLEELVEIVKTAAQRNKRARAVGSSWSFTDIAVTPGFVIETNRMTSLLTTVLPAALSPTATSVAPAGAETLPLQPRYVHVEAGIQLEALMQVLDMTHMAPATMGGAAGQTLAGVVSTSVHGSHFKLPPFPDWIRAIHLVGPDGRQYWIEPADRPITDDAKLRAALGPRVTVKRDNNWFDAALVTAGSLGIVYSVIIEVREEYKLRETRTELRWSALRPLIATAASGAFAGVDAMQVAIDPGSMGGADPLCFLSKRVAVPMSTTSTAGGTSFDPLAAFCEGDLMLELLFEAAKAIGKEPIVIPALLAALPLVPAVVALTALFPPALIALGAATTAAAATPILYPLLKAAGPGAIGDVVGAVLDQHPELVAGLATLLTKQSQGAGSAVNIAHNVMAPRNKGECAARGLALEIAFGMNGAHLRFIDAALAMLKSEAAMGHALGGWFAIRFVGRSRAILSPQRGAMTCMVEVVGLRTLSSTRVLLGKLEAIGRDCGGIQHWGMFDDLRGVDVAHAFPRLDTWRRVRWELTNGGATRTFDNDFTVRAGLSEPPTNPRWSSLAGGFTSGPAVASWARNHLDVFGRGGDNALWVRSWTGAAWNQWRQVAPNAIASDPAAVSWGPNRIDVFARGTDNQMYTLSWDGIRWSGWTSLGGGFTSGPAVTSWGPGRLDVFGRGGDNALYTNTWTGSWTGWRQVAPNPIASDPAAVSWGPNRIDVFARGTDNQMYAMFWDGSRWSAWAPLGGQFTSGPAAVAFGPNRLDVFGRGTDNALYVSSWAGRGWGQWRQVAPEPISSDPAAVSWGPNRVDVFARGTDNQMYTLSYDDQASFTDVDPAPVIASIRMPLDPTIPVFRTPIR